MSGRRRDPGGRHRRLVERGTIEHYEDTALYDHEYGDRTEDVVWYRKIARHHVTGGPVLELGAGTGRVSCPLALDGHRVLALDRMPVMLERLAERAAGQPWASRIEIVVAEMTEIPRPDESVDLVISPFNALMHLYSWEDLLRCFREVARVLVPGGAFAFDVENPDLEWLLWDPDERHAITRFTHPSTGERLVYSTNHTYDFSTQVCHIRLYYDDAPPRGRRFVPPVKSKKLVHLAHRQIFPEELRMLVATAGLAMESHCGDFVDGELGRHSQSQVVVCRKPAGV